MKQDTESLKRVFTELKAAAPLRALVAGALLWPATAVGQIAPFSEEAVQRGLVYLVAPSGSTLGYGAGCAIADLNGNGHQDIFVMGRIDGLIGFFENDARNPGHFADRSFKPDSHGGFVAKHTVSRASGVAVADYNGDGMLDLYITQYMDTNAGQVFPSRLLRNDGDFNFTDVAAEAGVTNMGNGEGAAWGDYDNDGWIDLYVANYGLPPYWNLQSHKNKLYRNLGAAGNSAFEDVSVQQGVDDFGQGFVAVFSDINRNGWLDLYVANDRGHYPGFSPNQLWMNNAGQFENACDDSGACLGLWSMGIAAGDFNGNGFPDFYITNIAHFSGYNGWNPLLVNQGDGTFAEQCVAAGVCQVITSWASIFFDYDNNGWLDLYVCNQFAKNNLFANNGTFPAVKVTDEAGVGAAPGLSYNAAVGDVTGNGALDLLVNNLGDPGTPLNVKLFINHEGVKRNWIRFEVAGIPGSGNVRALGANVEVTTASADEGGHTQWRETYAGGNNYKAQNEPVFHFGLGEAVKADQIVVTWPGPAGAAAKRTLTNYPANKHWTIDPPQSLGDFNGDGVIGVADLLGLLQAWGALTPGNEIMDITGDGQIGVGDLLALLAMWGGR